MDVQVASTDTIDAVIRSKPSMEELAYFPTMIYVFMLPDAESLNEDLLKAIAAEQDRDRKGIERSNFRNLGGWHSHNNLHQEPTFQALVQQIDEAAAMISLNCGYHKGHKLEIGTMWSIINRPGSYNRAHIHPGSIWSGVYYARTPERCGNIEFTDPRTQNLMNQPRYVPNRKRPRHCWTSVNFEPRAGKMLIFPSWLYHSVAPSMANGQGVDAERVILSFNLSQKKI